jgi:hypothetical protein
MSKAMMATTTKTSINVKAFFDLPGMQCTYMSVPSSNEPDLQPRLHIELPVQLETFAKNCHSTTGRIADTTLDHALLV